jgi:large subunit ribosomal protein L7/L12
MVSKLEKMLKQKETLENKIKREAVRDSSRKRKLDTKRKILVGAYYLKKHVDEGTWDNLLTIMDGFLINKVDRNAFDLAPREDEATNTKLKIN